MLKTEHAKASMFDRDNPCCLQSCGTRTQEVAAVWNTGIRNKHSFTVPSGNAFTVASGVTAHRGIRKIPSL